MRPLCVHFASTRKPEKDDAATMRPLCVHYASTMRPQRENTKQQKHIFATNRAAISRIWTILWGSRAGPWGHILAKSGPPGGPKTGRGKNGNPGNSKFPEMGDTRHNVVSGGGEGFNGRPMVPVDPFAFPSGRCARSPRIHSGLARCLEWAPHEPYCDPIINLTRALPPPFLLLLFLSFFCGLFLYFL